VSAWEEVRGQPAAVTTLRAALRTGDVTHAWLLVGPRGVGQQELARALAAALNCPEQPGSEAGCGTCETCGRVERGRHPVITELEPEGAMHVVESVRTEWIPMATRTLTEGRRRVIRVIAADRMNDAAQNAFLKVLEEPPASVVWVLDVQDESALLETVVSRCRRLQLVPWGPDALRELALEVGVPADQAPVLARAALGLPERLRDLADPDIAAARRRHLGIIDRLATAGAGQVVPLAKELAAFARGRAAVVKERNQGELAEYEHAFGVEHGRGWPPGVKTRLTRRFERRERQEVRRALDLVLDDLASYLRDLLVVGAAGTGEGLVNIDHEHELQRDRARLPATAVVEGLRAVARCRDALDRNGAVELQLERLLMALALPLYAAAS
jgi:DNA polymerase III subunit delta'